MRDLKDLEERFGTKYQVSMIYRWACGCEYRHYPGLNKDTLRLCKRHGGKGKR